LESPASSGDPGLTADVANELRELRLEVASLRSQLATHAAQTEEFRKRLQASRNQCERYSSQLKALRNSTSWSITRPLRMRRRKALNNGWT
jgi:chromosome segregation ATPase